MEQINLKEWLQGNCEYKGCIHNNDGQCECSDIWFMIDILNFVRENYEKCGLVQNEFTFNCNKIVVDDEYCKYCGSKILEKHVKYPYGDDGTYRTEWHCSKGCF